MEHASIEKLREAAAALRPSHPDLASEIERAIAELERLREQVKPLPVSKLTAD